ncbi:MAG: hypothetical protein RLY86_642 [Pseudomonadota bacterium]|jgi:hypothetical protein
MWLLRGHGLSDIAYNRPTVWVAAPQSSRLNIFDWAFFWVMTTVIVLGPVLKLGGIYGFGLTVLVAAIYGILLNRQFSIDYFSLFTVVAVIYVGLSYFEVLPASWTLFYEPGVIPIQAAFVIGLVPLIAAFRRFFGRAFASGSMPFCCVVLVVLGLTVSPWLESMVAPDSILAQGRSALVLSNLVNSELAMLLAWAYLIQVAGWRRLVIVTFIAVPILVFLVNRSMQINIALVMMFILLWRDHATLMFRFALVGFTAACVAGLTFIDLGQLALEDPNTTVRALMWKDGLQTVVDTYGVGIGFGREVVQNSYALLNRDNLYDGGDLMTGGIHNSYISMMMRTGLIGFIFFALGFLHSAWPTDRPVPERQTAYLAYLMAYISCWVNVAIESPLALIGVTMMLGFVQATRDKAEGRVSGYGMAGSHG